MYNTPYATEQLQRRVCHLLVGFLLMSSLWFIQLVVSHTTVVT